VGNYWAVVRLQTNREHLALAFLEREGFSPYYPCLRKWGRRFGRRIELRPPLFPGYVFIAIRLQWHAARWAPGTLGLIMDGMKPARCPDRVVAEIRRREVRGLVELPKAGLQRGERVRIIAGPFCGQLGFYDGMAANDRVMVLLSVLGRVTLPARDVEAVFA
jgi:transcriptional antiterminator RfaH